MLTLRGWMIDERSYAVRLAASLSSIPLTVETDRRAEKFGPTLADDTGLSCIGLYECMEYVARVRPERLTWPRGDRLALLHWAIEALETFSTARRAALSATMPMRVETDDTMTLYRTLEDHLARAALCGNAWLSGEEMGIIDIVAFPVAGLAHDLGIALDLYPAMRRFIRAMRERPGFVVMPGIPACH